MSLNRFEFEFLSYIERNIEVDATQRRLADSITISLGTVNKILKHYLNEQVIEQSNGKIRLTEEGLKLLEPYKVKRAIIIAAGFGERLLPVTLDTPKPLIKIKGKRIIDTLLDQLIEAEIDEIYLVRGYKSEMFEILRTKYPSVHFIENPSYNVTNNISSVFVAKDYIENTYICEADLYLNMPGIIQKYQYSTNYLGAYVKETDDWCFYKTNGYISKITIGGENCYHLVGISYWNNEDSRKLKKYIEEVYNSRGGKENYWDNVPLKIHKKDFRIEVRECLKTDVTEIDTFDELKALDSNYLDYERI